MKRFIDYLETRACVPAYSGLVLSGITICFFGAAINTMAGWLYVISGVSCALLFVAAILPSRSMRGLTIKRDLIQPVTVGNDLVVEFEITNQSKNAVSLLHVKDVLPLLLKQSQQNEHSIDTIAPQGNYRYLCYYPTERRGVYRWHTVEFRSGAPFGLFWSRRAHSCAATAIVYPQILPLNSCALIDEIGLDESNKGNPHLYFDAAATEGLVRSLRPYRIGDPIRLVHWRTSARYGELRVRELEIMTGGQDIIIALDSGQEWEEENFEQAVVAAASLYFYAQRQQMNVQLWTANTGLVKGERLVLDTLAATQPLQDQITPELPRFPLIWLTQNSITLSSIPDGSRWLLWHPALSTESSLENQNMPGIILNRNEHLQLQLQKGVRA